MTITTPGIYPGIAEETYHGDTDLAPKLGRSLSASGAKVLLDCPARYHWQRTHRVYKDVFDKGTIAHKLVLRSDDDRIRVADTYEWKPWQTWNPWKAEHRANGLIPIHRGDLLDASRMAAAVRRHKVASRLFSEGRPELSLYWIDEDTGVTCRGRLDWLRDDCIVDLKTTHKADDRNITKQSASFGYAMAADWYRRGVKALTGEWLPFIHVFVESEQPHIVHVTRLDDEFLAIGSEMNDKALTLFAECVAKDEWPGYNPDGITFIGAPGWLANEYLEME